MPQHKPRAVLTDGSLVSVAFVNTGGMYGPGRYPSGDERLHIPESGNERNNGEK